MSRFKIAVIIAAVVVAAVTIVVIGLELGGPGAEDHPPQERVRLEIRASEAATIVMDGKKLGDTPLGIYVAKSSSPVTLEATMVEHWMGRRGGKTMEPVRKM